MSNPPPKNKSLGLALIVVGSLILIALGAFVTITIGFRQSFTSSLPPIEDISLGIAYLSPIIILALLLIGYGRRLLRRS
jgi:ABC-type proline/glycine betaine transport system permease subunit